MDILPIWAWMALGLLPFVVLAFRKPKSRYKSRAEYARDKRPTKKRSTRKRSKRSWAFQDNGIECLYQERTLSRNIRNMKEANYGQI